MRLRNENISFPRRRRRRRARRSDALALSGLGAILRALMSRLRTFLSPLRFVCARQPRLGHLQQHVAMLRHAVRQPFAFLRIPAKCCGVRHSTTSKINGSVRKRALQIESSPRLHPRADSFSEQKNRALVNVLDPRGITMARADEYRRYAAECIRVAQQTKKQEDKLVLLQMAETWRRLAERAAQSGAAVKSAADDGTEDS
jgi:hypothetical protein